jgi:hypothetical protein
METGALTGACFFEIFTNVLTTKKIQGQKSALNRTKNLAKLKAAHAILNSAKK